jgi:hypothetical protein
MSIENNPLKQYFRRPSIYLKLPSKGLGYPPGVVDIPETGELPVYPMTAIDEITSKTPDALYNGTAVAEIIASCVPSIKKPWDIISTDLDAILVAIRIATNGNEMDIDTDCPACNEENKFGINLSIVLNNFIPGDYGTTLDVNDLKIKFKPLSYKEITQSSIAQFDMQKAIITINNMEDGPEKENRTKNMLLSIAQTTMEVLTNTIDSIATPELEVTERAYILDFLQNTDNKTFEAIKDRSIKLKETTQTKPLHMKCVSCEHEYDQPFTLNVSDFFG